jgi:HEXXH motif-containing protein
MPYRLNPRSPQVKATVPGCGTSHGEAFGNAVVGRPTDGASLATTLIHEFQHIVLGGVLAPNPALRPDPRERIYVPWRDDPRPFIGALQGVYAFFGMAALWRTLATDAPG